MVRKSTVTVIILCILWYTVSSMNNVIGKEVLNRFPYPLTVTFVQLLSITVYSIPLIHFLKLKTGTIPRSYYMTIIIPLCIGKFLSSVSSHISILKVPVSYAHTVKASMPLFTVALGRIIFKERQSRRVYISLIPIISGVAIATVTEISFDVIGLVAALLATAGFSLQNLFNKRVMKDTGIHSFELLALLGRIAFLMFIPVWFIFDARSLLSHSAENAEIDWHLVSLLLFSDGLLSFLQNIIAFAVLSRVTALTYAVANASKRIAIITISILMLRNPVTPTNIFGMSLAVGGVLLYTRAKHKDASMKSSLPVHNNDGNFNYLKTVI